MSFRGAVIDLDGTVYRGDRLLPGAADGVAALRDAGADVLFFSNNPTKPPAAYAEDLRGFGIEARPEDVLTSAVVTRTYLRRHHAGETAFVVGERGLIDQLDGVDVTADPERADVLVASIDRSLTYDRLTEALRAVRSGDGELPFVGTDPDRIVPAGPDEFIPGSGTVIGAIAAMIERDPDPMLGKPSELAVELALERLGVPAEACLVIGDRLDTDIALGARAGMTGALVLTGAHDRASIERFDATPDYVLETLGAVTDLL